MSHITLNVNKSQLYLGHQSRRTMSIHNKQLQTNCSVIRVQQSQTQALIMLMESVIEPVLLATGSLAVDTQHDDNTTTGREVPNRQFLHNNVLPRSRQRS